MSPRSSSGSQRWTSERIRLDVGNRTSLTVNGTTTTNTVDAANALTASGADTYSYDDNGNLTSKTVGGVTTDYGYDERNQLTSISGPTSASYVYNGDGLRVSKTVGATTTDYTWDPTGLGNVLSDGNEYVWGLGLISQIASGTPTYVQSDGLGSTRLLTDGTGTVVGTQDYDAFGATRDQTGVQLPFTYTGEQVDPESGLVYLRNRYLDPATGRFQTPDPLGFLGSGVNLYAYVGNNPIVGADPNGLAGDVDGELGDLGGGEGSSLGETKPPMSGSEPEDILPAGPTANSPLGEGEVCPEAAPTDEAEQSPYSKGSSAKLAKSMEDAGYYRAAGEAAHHIVGGNDSRAAAARAVLSKYGIDVNDAENGVYLPKNSTVDNPSGAAVHSTIHTNDYFTYVNDYLSGATSKSDLIERLQTLREMMESGSLPWAGGD